MSDINGAIRRALNANVGGCDDYTVAVTRAANDMMVIANEVDPNTAWPAAILLLVSIARSFGIPNDQLHRAVEHIWRDTENAPTIEQIEPS